MTQTSAPSTALPDAPLMSSAAGRLGIVLVVDDTEANRYAIAHMLRHAGYMVVEVDSGSAGIERARLGTDLVILDVNLPDLDGFEVARRLKADPQTAHIPVLHISAVRRETADRVHGLDAGADAYLVQPVDPKELVATTNALLRLRRAERELLGERTEATRLRHEAEAARQQAEASSRAKSEFLAVMSHELRTPLNAIAGYAEMLEMGVHGPLTEPQLDDLRRIRTAQRHLSALIDDVLDYVRLEVGRLHYAVTSVPVHETLASLEALIAPQVAARGLRYVYLPCEPSLTVQADAARLKQVVLNLITNAIKFTPRDGQIVLSCEAHEADVLVRVRDTGPGIAPDQVDLIFEPFVQSDAHRSPSNDGVGLGLSISRDLAHGMGGTLTVESEVGRGATFTLRLPRGG